VPASPVGSLKLTAIILGSKAYGQKEAVMARSVAIGVAKVVLHLPESGSLKAKRQVVHGLLRRVRAQFQVSAAEVGELDRWQLAELAIATVSGDGRHAEEVLAAVLTYIESHSDGARITDVSTELVRL
jgi:uncharacterized protein YlxP (DUF503 family)